MTFWCRCSMLMRLLTLLLLPHLTATLKRNSSSDCSGNLSQADVYLMNGDPLVWNCTAPEGYSWRDITFNASGQVIDSSYIYPDPTEERRALLNYTNTQTLCPKFYAMCFINKWKKKEVKHITAVIVDPIKRDDVNVTCHYYGLMKLRCGVKSKVAGDRFNLTINRHEEQPSFIQCNNIIPVMHTKCKGCAWCELEKMDIHNSFNLTINVTRYGFISESFNMVLDARSPANQMARTPTAQVTTTGTNASISLSGLDSQVYVEANFTIKTDFHVVESDRLRTITKRLTFVMHESTDFGKVEVSGLVADADYVLTVRSRPLSFDGNPTGFWSEVVQQRFHVGKQVPKPSIPPPGAFWIRPCNNGKPNCRYVNLYWQPVSLFDGGSKDSVFYEVSERSQNLSVKLPAWHNHHKFTLQQNSKPLTIQLVTSNPVGRSNSGQYIIPADQMSTPAPSDIRVEGSPNVTISWKYPAEHAHNLIGFHVYWCLTTPKAEMGNCSETPPWESKFYWHVGIRYLNASADKRHVVLPLTRLYTRYIFAVSAESTSGSSGMNWIRSSSYLIQGEKADNMTHIVVTCVLVGVIIIGLTIAACRWSAHLKQTACVKIWSIPRPDVPKPPGADEKHICSGITAVRGPQNRYHGGQRQYGDRARLPSDMTPLCDRSLSIESGTRFDSHPSLDRLTSIPDKPEGEAYPLMPQKPAVDADGSPVDSGVDEVSLTFRSSSHGSLPRPDIASSPDARLQIDSAPNGYVTVGLNDAGDSSLPTEVASAKPPSLGYCQLGADGQPSSQLNETNYPLQACASSHPDFALHSSPSAIDYPLQKGGKPADYKVKKGPAPRPPVDQDYLLSATNAASELPDDNVSMNSIDYNRYTASTCHSPPYTSENFSTSASDRPFASSQSGYVRAAEDVSFVQAPAVRQEAAADATFMDTFTPQPLTNGYVPLPAQESSHPMTRVDTAAASPHQQFPQSSDATEATAALDEFTPAATSSPQPFPQSFRGPTNDGYVTENQIWQNC